MDEDLFPGWEAQVGAQVRMYRLAHRMRQYEVATVIGTNRDNVSKIEHGHTALSLDKAVALCRRWRLTLEELTGFETEKDSLDVTRLRLLARRLPPQKVQALIGMAQAVLAS